MNFTSFQEGDKLTIALTGEIDYHCAKTYIRIIAAKIETAATIFSAVRLEVLTTFTFPATFSSIKWRNASGSPSTKEDFGMIWATFLLTYSAKISGLSYTDSMAS